MRTFPIIKFVILFIIGIVVQNYSHFSFSELLIVTSLTTLISFLLLFIFKDNRTQFFTNILFSIVVIAFGALLFASNTSQKKDIHFKTDWIKGVTITGIVTEIELPRKNEFRFTVETDSFIINQQNKQKVKKKFLCRFQSTDKDERDSIYENLKSGFEVSLTGNFSKGKEKRNPGEFDYRKYLNQNGFAGTFNILNTSDFIVLNNNYNSYDDIINSIRYRIYLQISKLHNEKTIGLLKGLLLADRNNIDYETKTEFINAGVIHVLAVSGLHVGFIAIIFVVMFGRFHIIIRYILTIIGLIFFLIITGAPPSVFRATIMAVLYLVAVITNRSSNPFNILSIAALVLLLINPSDLFNPGFQLSFAAVLSILIIYPLINSWISNSKLPIWIKGLLLFMGVSLAAQIGTLPLTNYYFGKLSLIALFSNLIVIPIIGLLVANGILTLILSTISISLASIYADANHLLSDLLFYFVKLSSTLPISFIRINDFTIYDSFVIYASLLLSIFVIKNFFSITLKVVSIVLIFFSAYFFIRIDDKPLLSEGKFTVVMIDVGQGDSFLIKFPNGETWLIDAGNATKYFDSGDRIIAPLLNYFNIDEIDCAVVTHMDSDHSGGFKYLFDKIKIKTLYKPDMDSNKTYDLKFEEYAKSKNIIINYYRDTSYSIAGTRIYFLNDTSDDYFSNLSENNRSGVIKIVHGNVSFLFTGDAEKESEDFLLKKYKDFMKSYVLKVGHHGSTSSSSPAFINKVKPEISLISAGVNNRFNHPSSIILNRLESVKSNIFRTDIEGAIILQSDGRSVSKIDWKN
ncbi:MAG: DNA internalization-related competence protein ComEC/Rec2 [Ignavibacteria bacterium]|nr:DNA internalization-related competence protein ComEC/Rec2 [Ignavibacteria bacterium]